MVYAVIAVVVIGAAFVLVWVFDRRRSREVRRDVPDRISEGLADPAARERSEDVHAAERERDRRTP